MKLRDSKEDEILWEKDAFEGYFVCYGESRL